MMVDITIYIKVFVTLLMLVNPLEGMPVFLSATGSAEPQLRKKILLITTLSVIVILIGSIVFGTALLHLFGISIGAFQVGGGIILFLIAVKMVLGSGSDSADNFIGGGKLGPEFGIVPLGTPLLAGPGAINGAVLFGTRAHTADEMLILAGIAMLVGIVLYIVLKLGATVARYIGKTGIDVTTRITGLLIAAIAAEMVFNGISSLFKL